MTIWQLNGYAIEQLRDTRNVEFVTLLNDLIAASARQGKVPDSEVFLTEAVNHKDGGIDARVAQAIPGDSTGRFGVPTCWQFKAKEKGNVGGEKGLRAEVNKKRAKELIQQGHAYRLCIADDLVEVDQSKWAGWLTDEARKINPQAPEAMVLAAPDIARWASRYASTVLRFRPELNMFRWLDNWKNDITYATPEYVGVGAWEPTIERIKRHVDLNVEPTDAVFTVHGESGVGKTRCVYEALATDDANRAVVAYTSNEADAERLARELASQTDMRAVIVADECTLSFRNILHRILESHRRRIRVVAIDNSFQFAATAPEEARLERIPEDVLIQILDRNFPGLSEQQRRSVAELTGGFVRLAVLLCERPSDIPLLGSIGRLEYFRNYYLLDYERLTLDQRNAILLLSLLPRVGHAGDIAEELAMLCRLIEGVNLTPAIVKREAERIKQSPGFVAFGPRYLYLTPQLIATVAFRLAWDTWIGYQVDTFFQENWPPEWIDRMLERVRVCGTEEMKQRFQHFFLHWASRLTPQHLGNEDAVKRLVRLAEVHPETYLPQVRRLIEELPTEELRSLHVTYKGEDWSELARNRPREAARRELVWLAEKFLRLPETFADAERIVLRLALAETEVYGNNATNQWTRIFRPLLSGTPISFADRLQLLEERFQSSDAEQCRLCLAALREVLSMDGTTFGWSAPPIIAGRVAPPEWRPATSAEARTCWPLVIETIRRVSSSANPAVRVGVREAIIERLYPLLSNGYLADVQRIMAAEPLSDAQRLGLLHEIDEFLEDYCEPGASRVTAETERVVREWREQLVPQNLHGRLSAVISQQPWQLWGQREEQARTTLAQLARELLDTPGALDAELPWLFNPEARSAALLGEAIAELDRNGAALDSILTTATAHKFLAIASGYLRGLNNHHPQLLDRANSILDRLQPEHPRTVYEMMLNGTEGVRPLPRLLEMVDRGLLKTELLRAIEFGIPRALTQTEFVEVMGRLVRSAEAGDDAPARAAVRVLWRHLHSKNPPPGERPDDLAQLLHRVLTASIPHVGRDTHYWMELLGDLAIANPDQAVELAVTALNSEWIQVSDEANEALQRFATQWPDLVVAHLGRALTDPASGSRLFFRQLRPLIESLPEEALIAWVDHGGLTAARGLAGWLPVPNLDENRRPVVPRLTRHVLDRYGSDERVYRSFFAGVHNGQVYEGDIATHYERDADVARRLLDHPSPVIRKWAAEEIDYRQRSANWHREIDEEMSVPQ